MRWFIAAILTFVLFALIIAFVPMGAAYYGTQPDFLLRTMDEQDVYGQVERELLRSAGLNPATSDAVLHALHLRPLLKSEAERLLPPFLHYLRTPAARPPTLDLRPLREGVYELLSDTDTYMEIMRVHDPDEFLRLQNMTPATRAETIPTLVHLHIDSAGIPERLDTAAFFVPGGMVDLSWSHQFLTWLRRAVAWFPYTVAAGLLLAALLFVFVGRSAFWAIFTAFLPAAVGLFAVYFLLDRLILATLLEEVASDPALALFAQWPQLLLASLLRIAFVYLAITGVSALLGIILRQRGSEGAA